MSALANRSGSPSTRLLASLTLRSLTVAIVALATGASCASSLEAMGSRAAATTTSAVGIEAEGCSLVPAVASGTVVGAPGLVMTVAHAVAGSRRITVTDENTIQRTFHGAEDGWLAQAATEQPFGRLIDPDEVARAICFLASSESGLMTGSVIDFDQTVQGAGDAPKPNLLPTWGEEA